ncbi:glycine cleavage system H protein [Cnuibacter physcomitrellae]|uniref:Glycine cleavage system H protein n=1 Tax=Cnuibacter physcomitrellae TaxID=1619308 RepID=A0A1X9LML3_9MICO|nr:glycine cleavage system protein GcvH [Cnuibacter physcomitrellae]ARJ05722.1 glycine cleavage system protein H [Cnuibacter physcomitrellae]MCS5496567.1 glycine cleavage system protein GcvH [Cnuibacter physcomitrellae]GGI36334.1 glycine cleavage system H protein [Cnuibacter physcomitrellae]
MTDALPDDLGYTAEHEWVRIDGDTATIGITDYAAQQLGDIVYLDLPDEGADVSSGAVVGEIESTKSVGELFSPLDGTVLEKNADAEAAPETVNGDPYGAGWLLKVRFAEQPALLTAAEYAALIGR